MSDIFIAHREGDRRAHLPDWIQKQVFGIDSSVFSLHPTSDYSDLNVKSDIFSATRTGMSGLLNLMKKVELRRQQVSSVDVRMDPAKTP